MQSFSKQPNCYHFHAEEKEMLAFRIHDGFVRRTAGPDLKVKNYRGDCVSRGLLDLPRDIMWDKPQRTVSGVSERGRK